MRQGCLGAVVAWGFGIGWMIMTPFVIYYAPGSWLTGFVYGAGSVVAAFCFAMRSSNFEAYANWQSKAHREASEGLKNAPEFRDRVLGILGMLLTICFGILAALFLIFAIATATENNFGPNLTGASMGFGIFLAMSAATYRYIRKPRFQ